MAPGTNIVNNVKWTSLSAVVNMIAKLAQVAVLARFLVKADFGLVAIALLFISFTEIFMDMGFSSAVLHRQKISRDEYSSLYWFNIFSGVVLFVLLCLCTPLIAAYYAEEELITIISLLALNTVFSSFSRLQRTFQQKKLQFRFISLVEMVASVSMVIVSIVLAYLNFGVYSLVYSTLFYGFFVACVYLTYSIFWEKNVTFHFRFSETKPFLKIGIYQVGSSVLDYFSREMDIVFISSVYSLEILGAYSLCKQLALRVMGVINPIITKVLTPTLALFQDDRKLLKSKYMEVLRMLSVLNFPIYFFMAYASTYILGILYGSSYAEYGLILSILAVNFAFSSIGNPQGALIVAIGRTDAGFYWTIYRIISTYIFLKIGSYFNIYLFTASILLVNILNIYSEVKFIYQRFIGIKYWEYVGTFKIPLIICLLLLPLYFLQDLLVNKYLGISVAGILFASTYLLSCLIWNYDQMKKIEIYLKIDKFCFCDRILKMFICYKK